MNGKIQTCQNKKKEKNVAKASQKAKWKLLSEEEKEIALAKRNEEWKKNPKKKKPKRKKH